MIRVRNGRPGNQIMMERTENRRWPDELGLGPAQQIEPRRVGQNSSAQVGQNSWTQPVLISAPFAGGNASPTRSAISRASQCSPSPELCSERSAQTVLHLIRLQNSRLPHARRPVEPAAFFPCKSLVRNSRPGTPSGAVYFPSLTIFD